MAKGKKWSEKDLEAKGFVVKPSGDWGPGLLDELDAELDKPKESLIEQMSRHQQSIEESTQKLHAAVKALPVKGMDADNDLAALPPVEPKLLGNKIDWLPTTPQAYDGSTLNREYPMALTEAYRIPSDLFGQPLPVEPEPISAATRPLVGQDIINIRQLTGKRRDAAIKALNEQAEAMLAAADPDCLYVPGNTASSKNNKEIGFYWKKNERGINEKVNILVDSERTKKYRKNTASYWLANKVSFLNQTRNLELPLSIEFTFIRESLRRFDLLNACQVVADLMAENGYMVDDESCYFIPSFGPVYYHAKLAGVLIRVIK